MSVLIHVNEVKMFDVTTGRNMSVLCWVSVMQRLKYKNVCGNNTNNS